MDNINTQLSQTKEEVEIEDLDSSLERVTTNIEYGNGQQAKVASLPLKDQQKRKKVIKQNTKMLARCAIFVALIAVGAFIKIPIPVVPFTLQVLFTTLTAYIMGVKWGTATISIYVFMGLIGIPIFTQGGGFMYVVKPTFGYLIGFILGTFITAFIIEKSKTKSLWTMIWAGLCGLVAVYVVGVIYLCLIKSLYLGQSISVWSCILYGAIVFLPGDIFSVIFAAVLAKKLFPFINQKIKSIDKIKKVKEVK